MAARRSAFACAAVLLARFASAQAEGHALARLAVVDQAAELRHGDARWTQAREGMAVEIGDAVRVGPQALARLELPWMAVTVSAGASLRFADQPLLAALLEGGRALVESERHPMLKLVTPGAEVRGRGRAVVRVDPRSTMVSCLAGRFDVASPRGAVSLTAGRGCVVLRSGRPSAPLAIPAAPKALAPGADPRYAERGEPVELSWDGRGAGFQLELLPVGSEVVLLAREAVGPPLRLAVPWPGAFRWRVSARDARGLEGPPSGDGLLAIE